jgi:tRNA A37 threonylcarbamoyladenosine synthetase subunit TsaC/SUA5/YrdC
VKELGHPVLNASLGNSREEILNDPEVIRSAYEERTDLILAGGNSAMDFSTVIDLTDDQPSIVRQGAGEVPELTVAAESA